MTESATTREHQSHPQTPSAHFAELHKAIEEHVHKTAAERENRLREERDRTRYHRDAERAKGT